MVGNCLDAITAAVDLNKRAGTLILDAKQITDLDTAHVPAIVGSWVSQYETGSVSRLSAPVLSGIISSINALAECFRYNDASSGTVVRRWYRSLSSRYVRQVMVSLKRSDIRILDDAFDMHSGYVLNFSDRTMAEFFEDEFGVDIYQEKYGFDGTSKAKPLRAFIETEDEYTVAKVARTLWQHRENLSRYQNKASEAEALKARFFDLVARIKGGGSVPRTDALDRERKSKRLEELIAAIERDIGANKPAAALDRLHTYCMKKFAHLLEERGCTWDRNYQLQSLGRAHV